MKIERPALRPTAAALVFGLAFGFISTAGSAEAATYYVRKSGNDSAAGTSAGTAFRTLQQAAATLVAGDTVYVGAGTYTESVTELEDGADGNLIYWVADTDGSNTGDAGTVTWRPADGGSYALRLGNEHHLVFYRFRFAANPNAAGADGVSAPNGYELYFSECRFDGLNVGLYVADGAAACFDGAFANCTTGVRADRAGVHHARDTFTDCGSSIYAADAAAVTAEDCTFTNAPGAGNHLNLPNGTALTLRRCAVTGGLNGVYQPDGPSAVIEDCTFSGASSIALWLAADDINVDGCDVSSLDTAVYLPAGGGDPLPWFQDTTIRDSDTGIYTQLTEVAFRNVVMSGHWGEAIHLPPSLASFRIGVEDTLTCTGNAIGLRWYTGSVFNALTLEGQSWSDNAAHVNVTGVETVTATDCTFSGGGVGVRSYAGNTVTLRRVETDGCGVSDDWSGVRFGAQIGDATVVLEDCAFENGHRGLQLNEVAADPDLRNLRCADNADIGLDLNRLTWTWNAADAVTLTGNRVGLVANDCTITIDGGAAGIDVAGNTAAGYSHALYFDGGTVRATNVRTADSNVGFDFRDVADVELTDCTATACQNWGAFLQRGSSTDTVVAVLRSFTASECAGGVQYNRGTAGGVGQIVLENVACTRTVAADADGVPDGSASWPHGTSGTGFFLNRCPLDPAYHTGLSARGHAYGAIVMDADATIAAAADPHFRGCLIGVQVKRGSATITDWVADGNFYPVEFDPDHDAHDLTLTDCDLWGSLHAVRTFDLAGSVTATGCTFASRDHDAVRLEAPVAAPTIAFADCTVTTTGGDGFRVNYQGAAGGASSFTDCRVIDAAGDGFDLLTAAAGSGTGTFVRCTVDAADDDGFDLDGPAGTLRDCVVTSVGDDAFTLHRAAADVADCVALAAGKDGFLLRDCPAGSVARCTARNCASAAFESQEACGTITVDNLLCVNCEDGLQCETTAGTTTFRHCTAVTNDDAARVYSGDAAYINCVLVGADTGVKVSAGGTATLEHVLIDSPTPYGGTSAGANDMLKRPLFRDAAGGDYRLAEGSPAINAGKDLSGTVDDDLLGQPRPSYRRHDLGAYEYQEAGGSLRILDWRERAN